jgi:large conductance mechanosensitive channel
MSILKEFKEFAMKGNVVDLAVAVIIGAAFGKIIDSMGGDIIMPLVGSLFGKLDFASFYFPLAGQDPTLTIDKAKELGAVLAFGNFITIALNFIIMALTIFMMVRMLSKIKKSEPSPAPAAPAPTPEDIVLLREIRDSLKK